MDRLTVNLGVTLQQFTACEAACVPLLASEGRPPSQAQLQEAAARVDHVLWALFPTDPVTAAFWTDGIEAESVDAVAGGVALLGLLWCADHRDQWRVPIRAELGISTNPGPQLDQIRIFVGDAARGSLRQPSSRGFRAPDQWLCEFLVKRPQSPAVAPERTLRALRDWLAANPTGGIVDRDWQPLPRGAAESLIAERAAAGIAIGLRPSWLDGRDVLQLDQSPDPSCPTRR